MTVKKNHVLWLPKWYPNRLDRYDGNFIEAHALAVAPHCRVSILFVHSDPELKETYQLEKSTSMGIPVTCVYFKRPHNRIPGLTNALLLFRYVRAQFKGYKSIIREVGVPDLTHVHVLTRSSFLAWWLRWRKKIPYLVSEHWSGYFEENGAYAARGWLKKWATRFVCKRAAGITVVSEHLRNSMQSHRLKNRYALIANVVDTRLFLPKPPPAKASPKKKLVHISTLDTIPKNFPKILKVIAGLYQKRQDFELHVLGDGHEGPDQRKLAEDLGLRDKVVFFYGNVEKEEVAQVLSEASALLIFSLWENQPCVMVESFAAGVPVIAPSVGGIPEHLDASKGILIERDNEQAFARAIEKVLDDGIGHDPTSMHEYAQRHFSNEAVGRQFAELYREVVPLASRS